MITVDVLQDRVILHTDQPKEELTVGQAALLLADVATAIELMEMEPAVTGPPVTRWSYREAGDYYSILSDGRTLRVYKLADGWYGAIDNEVVNPGMPGTRKKDVQRLLESRI